MNARAFFFGLLLALALPVAAPAQEPSADFILAEMEKTYAALRSYADTSTVRFRNPDESDGAQVEFRLWFARPQFFRIDASTRATPDAAPVREVMWFDGETARTWATGKTVVTRSKIQLAGSKMFGTYAYHIPTLLEKSYAGPIRLSDLTAPTLVENEAIDGVDCHHLRGAWQGDDYEVWIGQADHLVRKLSANYSGYRMEETHREIKTNEPIPPAVFRFAPEDEGGQPLQKATPPPPLPGERRRP